MSGHSNIREIQCLSAQNYTCFLCDVSIFPCSALFRCVIPRSDRYWARVYGESGAEEAFRRARKERAFCRECAPADAVPRVCGPSSAHMRAAAKTGSNPALSDWFLKNSFSYKKNFNKKTVLSYTKYLSENSFISFDEFRKEGERIYAQPV